MTPVDRDHIFALCGNDAGEVRELLDLAVTSARTILEGLATAAARSDSAELKGGLHELRGSCANVGAVELAAIAGRFEERLATEGVSCVGLAELDAALDRLAAAANELQGDSSLGTRTS